jgi:ABC-2 type transport system ATP-binding protein
LRLIAAYARPSAGEVLVMGENHYENPNVMPHVAFISNKSEENNPHTIRKMLEFYAKFRPNWDEEYAQRLASRFELSPKKAVSSLSHGERAAVHAVMGLAARTPVTIYDEAYLGMGAAFRKMFVNEILNDYMRHPRTILFSTHYIDEMSKLFGEVIIMDKGKIVLHEDGDIVRQKRLDQQSASLQDLFIELTGGVPNESI